MNYISNALELIGTLLQATARKLLLYLQKIISSITSPTQLAQMHLYVQ